MSQLALWGDVLYTHISIVTCIVDKYSDIRDKVSFVSALAFPKLAKARPRIRINLFKDPLCNYIDLYDHARQTKT